MALRQTLAVQLEFLSTSVRLSVPVAQFGTNILGIPVGSPEFIQSECTKAANRGHELSTKLTELGDPQSASYC